MQGTFQFITDTAALCIHDLAALRHRLEDTSDWWSIPEDELAEVNAGNCLVLNLGADGVYEVMWRLEKEKEDDEPFEPFANGSDLSVEPLATATSRTYYFCAPEGDVFVGAAEDMTGGDLVPDETCDGVMLKLEPGSYGCTVIRKQNKIELTFRPSSQGHNHLQDLIRI